MVRMVCEHQVLLVKRGTEVKSCMYQQPLASSSTMAVSTQYEDNKCNLSLSALCSLGLTLFPSPSSPRKEKEGKSSYRAGGTTFLIGFSSCVHLEMDQYSLQFQKYFHAHSVINYKHVSNPAIVTSPHTKCRYSLGPVHTILCCNFSFTQNDYRALMFNALLCILACISPHSLQRH